MNLKAILFSERAYFTGFIAGIDFMSLVSVGFVKALQTIKGKEILFVFFHNKSCIIL